MKLLKLLLVGIGVILVFVACGDSSSKAKSTMDIVKERGKFVVGVKKDAPNFGLLNSSTNEIEGFEIDLAKMIAEDILGDENKIQLEPVTAKTRGPLLDNGTLDAVIATFTITDERKKTYDFTTPYYSDPVGFLVLKENNFTDIKSLDGKTIGVSQSSTTRNVINKAAEEVGVTVRIQEYPDYPSLKSALDSKRIAAFSVDKSILRGYLDDRNIILDDNLQPQDYGIATRRSDAQWSQYISDFVENNKDAIDALATKWNLK